jgi:hypothetical protein
MSNPASFQCAARRYGDITACGRCGLRAPSNEFLDGEVICKERTDPPIGLEEIRNVAIDAALAIEDQQNLLMTLRADALAHGDTKMADSLRNAPRMEELRRAAVLRAIAGLVDRIAGDAEIKKRLRGAGDGEPGDRGRSAA